MEWYKLLDPSTGFYFFACPQTGQCSWKEPTSQQVKIMYVSESLFPAPRSKAAHFSALCCFGFAEERMICHNGGKCTIWHRIQRIISITPLKRLVRTCHSRWRSRPRSISPSQQTNGALTFVPLVWELPQGLPVVPVPLRCAALHPIYSRSSAFIIPLFSVLRTMDSCEMHWGRLQLRLHCAHHLFQPFPHTSLHLPRKYDLHRLDEDEVDLDEDEWEAGEDPRTGYNYYLHRRTRKLTFSKVEAISVEMALAEREASVASGGTGLSGVQSAASSSPAPATVATPTLAPPTVSPTPPASVSATTSAPAKVNAGRLSASAQSRPQELPSKPSQPPPEPSSSRPSSGATAPTSYAASTGRAASGVHAKPASLDVSTDSSPVSPPSSNVRLAPPAQQRKPSDSSPPAPNPSLLLNHSKPTVAPPPVPAPPPSSAKIVVEEKRLPSSMKMTAAAPKAPALGPHIPPTADPKQSRPTGGRPSLQRNATMPAKRMQDSVDKASVSPPAAVPSPFAIAAQLGAQPPKLKPVAEQSKTPSTGAAVASRTGVTVTRRPVLQKSSTQRAPGAPNIAGNANQPNLPMGAGRKDILKSRRLSLFRRPLPTPVPPTTAPRKDIPLPPSAGASRPAPAGASAPAGGAPKGVPKPLTAPPPVPAPPPVHMPGAFVIQKLPGPSAPRPRSSLISSPVKVPVTLNAASESSVSLSTSPTEKVVFSPSRGTIVEDDDYGFVHVEDTADEDAEATPQPVGRMHRVYSTVLQVSPVLFVANTGLSPSASSPSLVASSSSSSSSTARPTLQRSLTERPRGVSRDPPLKPHPFPRPPELPVDLVEEINLFQLEGFGRKFFRTAKKGLFRRLIPVRQLLQWSKDAPISSLLRLNKRVKKFASTLFRLVQVYMGDKDPQTPFFERLSKAQELIEKCVQMAELRDEAYCILCKQTCNNPSMESTIRGWELICLVTQCFPPTNDLESWLRSYIKESAKLAATKKDEKLFKYASFCLRKLESICRDGGRGNLMDVVEIERAIQFPLKPPIFGGTLAEIMSYQADRPQLRLPLVCVALVRLLDKLRAETVEGIFRLPGSSSGISKMRILVETQNYSFNEADPHVPASALKLWLRQLEDPIIPESLYAKCIDASKAEDPIKCCDIVLRELPEPNRSIALYLIKWIQRLSLPDNQKLNKMGVANFAIMFGPCFMRTPHGDPSFLLEAARWEQGFVSHLLKNLDVSEAPDE